MPQQLAQAADSSGYLFRAKLATGPHLGLRIYPHKSVVLRLEGQLLFWQLKYPSSFFTGPDGGTPILDPTVTSTSEWTVHPSLLIGLGFGLFQAPNLNEILLGVRPSLIGLAASTNAVLKNLGSLLGITLIVSVFAWLSGNHPLATPEVSLDLASFQTAFALAALVAALNLIANLLPRKP